ncbi:MAG: PAS domain-containing protein [Clostridiales bacterium]|jgi:two-component system phosphate regulon sensor histidine kinase PhoR|nr:PAS domain-containing protein [Clostridiales bacterium]
MNKRVFRSMMLVVLISVLAFAGVWGLVFSRQLNDQAREGLKTLRVTVIAADGQVTFDSGANPKDLDNHADRAEVRQAALEGFGESERYSDTLKERTYYYAVRLGDGNILRLALKSGNINTLLSFGPLTLVCLSLSALLAFLAARRLTKRIVAPINTMNLDEPRLRPYEELVPLVEKLESQRAEISAQLAEIEKRSDTIAAITDNMREGLLLLDENGDILLANKSVLQILGEQDLIGKNAPQVCPDAGFNESIHACFVGRESETILQKDGKKYAVFCNPVSRGEGLEGAVVFIINATDKYASESQRKEFSANVSHELKTPLTTIAALSEMIENGTVKKEDVRSFAGKLSAQTRRLIAVIEDIIRLSEFDEGGISREFSRFNLREVAELVLEGLKDKGRERNVTAAIAGSSPLWLTANRRMIDELLYNLVDNAIKYNHEGGRVIVSLREKDGACEISVADTGIGIPPAHIPHIFERFYRVDKSRSKKTGGTGLGLSIVKHIVEHHGGRIHAESAEGAGTEVICVIPKAPPQGQNQEREKPQGVE